MSKSLYRIEAQIFRTIEKQVERIKKIIYKILAGKVPWDTGELRQEGIIFIDYRDGNDWVIKAFISSQKHSNSNETHSEIAEKLEIGINLLTGMPLLRTKRSLDGKHEARTPTKGWWSKSVKEIEKELAKLAQ